jgi:hypothetical protein
MQDDEIREAPTDQCDCVTIRCRHNTPSPDHHRFTYEGDHRRPMADMPPDPFGTAIVITVPVIDKGILLSAFCLGYLIGAILWGGKNA